MNLNIGNRQRAMLVGLLILVAYSMLTYTITQNKILGTITDIISGISVICISLLMYPLFNNSEYKKITNAYLISRIIEGFLMIVGGIFILIPSLEIYRSMIYQKINDYPRFGNS